MTHIPAFLQPFITAIQQQLCDTGIADEDPSRKTAMMYGITIVGIFFLLLLSVLAFIQDHILLASIDLIAALLLTGLLFFLSIKGYLYACIYTGIALMYGLYLYLFISGGIAGTAFVWSYTFPLFAFYLLGHKKGLLISLLYFLSCLAVLVVDLNSPLIYSYDKNLALRFIPSFLVVILFSYIYEKSRHLTLQTLLNSKNILEVKIGERTTKLQQEIEARQKSEQRLQLALEGTNDGLWDWNIKTDGVYFSPSWKKMLGYEDHELPNIFAEWQKRVHPDDLPRALSNVMATAHGEQNALDCTYRMRHKDGQFLWILSRGKLFLDADNQPSRMVGTHVDITERMKYEAALQHSKDEWEKTFNAIPDVITIQDKDMRIVRANKAAYQFFAKAPGTLVGELCHQILRGISEPCQGCPLPKTRSDKGNYTQIINHKGLGKTFQVSSSSILDDSGAIQYLVHIARDITEQKKQEQFHLQMNVQQEQLKRFESLRTMAGAIAHRFNNAMTAVLGNLDLLFYTLPDDGEHKKMASAALQAAKGASTVGTMMLSYVGQRTRHLQTSNLVDLATECATELQSQFETSFTLKCLAPPEPLYCSIDPQQIKEVIRSIITNAIEAGHDQTAEVEISFGNVDVERSSFPVVFQGNSTESGKYTFCQIRDTGQGILPEDLEHVFEPFFTTKFVGRGLGLALSVGIMQSHHGALLVESTPGAGTTVKMLLPAMEPIQKKTEAPARGISQNGIDKLSGDILLADDEDIVLAVGEKMLMALGLTVHTAVNGIKAVEMVRRQDVAYQAVVMDISMPEMDGLEAMRQIRKINAELPILLSSGYAEEEFIFDDEKGRPDGFLEKPFQLAELQNSLEKLLP